jgi:hypothetical protein
MRRKVSDATTAASPRPQLQPEAEPAARASNPEIEAAEREGRALATELERLEAKMAPKQVLLGLLRQVAGEGERHRELSARLIGRRWRAAVQRRKLGEMLGWQAAHCRLTLGRTFSSKHPAAVVAAAERTYGHACLARRQARLASAAAQRDEWDRHRHVEHQAAHRTNSMRRGRASYSWRDASWKHEGHRGDAGVAAALQVRRVRYCHSALLSVVPTGILHIRQNGARKNDTPPSSTPGAAASRRP